MSKVDWSLAPEGATHFRQDSRCYSTAGIQYYILLDDQWFYWAESLGAGWKTCHRPCGPVIKLDLSSSKPWSGPEDGLPPVGMTIEALWSDRGPVYKRALVLAHDEGNAVYRWIEGERKGEYQADRTREIRLSPVNPMFRPVKKPEQLAADLRETAIREIMDVADVDCRVTAARLVDAGFKREVV